MFSRTYGRVYTTGLHVWRTVGNSCQRIPFHQSFCTSLLKQGRDLVGSYKKNVMRKNLGETLFCLGFRLKRQLRKEQVFQGQHA